MKLRPLRRLDKLRHCRGFSLVEVMVALVVCSIGLLGLAKMESLALVSTNVGGARSIAAIQASSLAAAMHANRGYWAAGTAPAAVTVTIASGVVTITDPTNTLSTVGPACLAPGAAACTANQMAAYDLQNWATALETLMPVSFVTISCTITTATPVTCTIQIQWAENAVALNQQQQAANTLSTLGLPTYVLYVEP
jgi:type IV pilus assembly protein PilV